MQKLQKKVSEEEVIKLLSKEFGGSTRYRNAKNPLAITWLISFDHIRKHHQLAASFLSSMSCLHEKSIPRSLLPEANSEIDTIDTIAILTGYSFVRRLAGSHDITDREEFYDLLYCIAHCYLGFCLVKSTRNYLRGPHSR